GLLYLAQLPAKDYYVDANATGEQTGSKTKPFQTVRQAAERLQPGDVCYIAAGTYHETVTPARSGIPGNPIVFQALDAGVVITGTDPLPRQSWERYAPGIFRCRTKLELDHENQVFLEDQALVNARWPNVGADLLQPTLATMDAGTTPDHVRDAALPGYDWTGARMWVHAPMHWANWTTDVRSFASGQLRITNNAPYPGPRQHVAADSAEYFLYNCLAALDAENEWCYEAASGYLYVYRQDDRRPTGTYYVKRRMLAFDLDDRAYVTLRGFTVNGASISTSETSHHVVLDRLKVFHPYYSTEANEEYGRQLDKGLSLLGHHCTVQHCEVAYSSGCGILLRGRYNLVFNSYVHDTDYIGTYAANIKLEGEGNVISHCTLSRTGRAVIDYGDMYRALIQYCDMNQSGMLTRDAGLTYGNVIHGGGSEMRYNWLHDNRDDHWDMGIYYDHGTQNILTHHNVVWGVDYFGLMINHYGYFHEMYNNTFASGVAGFRSTWGNEYPPDLYGSRFANNIFSKPVMTTASNHVWRNNAQGYAATIDHKYLPEGSPCSDAGIVIPGITDSFTGVAPDLGAYETGRPRWRPGHDFTNVPTLDTTRTLSPYRNRLGNSAFEHHDHISPWVARGPAASVRGGKGQTSPDTQNTRMGKYSIGLGKDGEITQRISGLEPNSWYEFSAFLRVPEEEYVTIGVRGDGESVGPAIEGNFPYWHRAVFQFKTGPGQTTAEVFIRSIGPGAERAYVDDCGLILVEPD
ncbi:MAG: right-handed parallel beta-helix repeat-containing protein, partial [Bacteroidota bacterium]